MVSMQTPVMICGYIIPYTWYETYIWEGRYFIIIGDVLYM